MFPSSLCLAWVNKVFLKSPFTVLVCQSRLCVRSLRPLQLDSRSLNVMAKVKHSTTTRSPCVLRLTASLCLRQLFPMHLRLLICLSCGCLTLLT